MKQHNVWATCLTLLIFASCKSEVHTINPALVAPDQVEASQTRSGELSISWRDNSEGEDGFIIECRTLDGEYSEWGRVDANETTFTTTDLPPSGKSYYFAVSSYKGSKRSYPGTLLFKVVSADEVEGIFITRIEHSHAGFVVAYTPAFQISEGRSYGLCWSEDQPLPTVKEYSIPAPTDLRGREEIVQSVPVTHLKGGTSYYVRAYSKSRTDQVSYSKAVQVTLDPMPKAILLEWNSVSLGQSIAPVEVYRTTSRLSGRPFNAWYAIADLSKGNVALRVLCADGGRTVEQQMAEQPDALVMTNGGYFYSGSPVGVLADEKGFRGVIDPLRGTLKVGDAEYKERYNTLRGFFGVESGQNPFIAWVGSQEGRNRFFPHPQPVVQGEAKYARFIPEVVGQELPLSPAYGVSAGPILLKGGEMPFGDKRLIPASEKYLANYELMPYDIFGPEVLADRTAIGIRADGKVILLVCDGRIDASKGATLEELARIMKGLGCVDALNLDGGGSTAMVAAGERLNDATPNSRPVVTTIGFFKQ